MIIAEDFKPEVNEHICQDGYFLFERRIYCAGARERSLSIILLFHVLHTYTEARPRL